MTDYYVSQVDGNDSYNGQYPTFQGGSDGPWLTVSKVQSTLTGDQSDNFVYFRHTGEWREQLTCAAYGTSGHQFTLGMYGTGPKPIINGSDLITGWTRVWVTALNISLPSTLETSAERNYRNTLPANMSSYSGIKVRATMTAGAAGSFVFDGTSIGVMTSNDDFDSAPTRITWDNGNYGATVTADGTKVSDEMDFIFTKTVRHGFHIYAEDRANIKYTTSPPASGGLYYNTGPGDDTLTQSVTYSTASEFEGITKLEVQLENVWQATCSTEPNQVFFNGIRGNKQSSFDNVDSENDWYWAANILYVYSTADPDVAYVHPGIEASSRICINLSDNHVDYINVTGLILRRSNSHGISTDGCTNLNIYSNTFSHTGKRGINLYNGSNNCAIHNNIFEYCGVEIATQEHSLYIEISDDVDIYENEISHSWNKGIIITGGNRIKIYRNYFHDNNEEDIPGNGDIQMGANDGDITDVEIYYNLFDTPNSYSIYTEDFGGGHSFTGLEVYNNSFWGTTDDYIIRIEDMTNVAVKNNIFYANGNYVFLYDDITNFSGDYNCYYGWTHGTNIGYYETGYVTWATWSATETHSINADPLMIDPSNGNFNIQSSSPCINAGTGVSLSEDYRGVAVPVGPAPDMGAYEFNEYASDYLENAILKHTFKVTALAQPSNLYVALCKSTIEDDDTGSTLPSEVSGGDYARKQCNTWSISGGTASNNIALSFPEATNEWGLVTDFAICDASTGGNMFYYGKFNNSKHVHTGDIFTIAVGDLSVEAD